MVAVESDCGTGDGATPLIDWGHEVGVRRMSRALLGGQALRRDVRSRSSALMGDAMSSALMGDAMSSTLKGDAVSSTSMGNAVSSVLTGVVVSSVLTGGADASFDSGGL